MPRRNSNSKSSPGSSPGIPTRLPPPSASSHAPQTTAAAAWAPPLTIPSMPGPPLYHQPPPPPGIYQSYFNSSSGHIPSTTAAPLPTTHNEQLPTCSGERPTPPHLPPPAPPISTWEGGVGVSGTPSAPSLMDHTAETPQSAAGFRWWRQPPQGEAPPSAASSAHRKMSARVEGRRAACGTPPPPPRRPLSLRHPAPPEINGAVKPRAQSSGAKLHASQAVEHHYPSSAHPDAALGRLLPSAHRSSQTSRRPHPGYTPTTTTSWKPQLQLPYERGTSPTHSNRRTSSPTSQPHHSPHTPNSRPPPNPPTPVQLPHAMGLRPPSPPRALDEDTPSPTSAPTKTADDVMLAAVEEETGNTSNGTESLSTHTPALGLYSSCSGAQRGTTSAKRGDYTLPGRGNAPPVVSSGDGGGPMTMRTTASYGGGNHHGCSAPPPPYHPNHSTHGTTVRSAAAATTPSITSLAVTAKDPSQVVAVAALAAAEAVAQATLLGHSVLPPAPGVLPTASEGLPSLGSSSVSPGIGKFLTGTATITTTSGGTTGSSDLLPPSTLPHADAKTSAPTGVRTRTTGTLQLPVLPASARHEGDPTTTTVASPFASGHPPLHRDDNSSSRSPSSPSHAPTEGHPVTAAPSSSFSQDGDAVVAPPQPPATEGWANHTPNEMVGNRMGSVFMSASAGALNYSALIQELEQRRQKLRQKLNDMAKDIADHSIFAIVRSTSTSQLHQLLQAGLCNVNEQDHNGCTPLHIAASEGNQAIVRLLLSYGADILKKDLFGRTPLDCAAANRQSVGRYLLSVLREQRQAAAAAAAPKDSSPTLDTTAPSTTDSSSEGDAAGSGMIPEDPPHPHHPPPTSRTDASHFHAAGVVSAVGGPPALLPPEPPASKVTIVNKTFTPNVDRDRAFATEGDAGDSASSASSTESPNTPRQLPPTQNFHSLLLNVMSDNYRPPTEESVPVVPPPPPPAAPLSASGFSTPQPSEQLHGSTARVVPPSALQEDDTSPSPEYRRTPAPLLSGPFAERIDPLPTVPTGSNEANRSLQYVHSPVVGDAANFPSSAVATAVQQFLTATRGGPGTAAALHRPSILPGATEERYRAAAAAVAATAAAQHTTTTTVGTAEDSIFAMPSSPPRWPDAMPLAPADAAARATSRNSFIDEGSIRTLLEHAAAQEQHRRQPQKHEEKEFSTFTTVNDYIPLIVCMSGLPGRGKSFISKRLVRYLNWKGVPCAVFNAGNYRRQLLGVAGTADAAFFDPNNPVGKQLRERMAELACEDLVNFIAKHQPLSVGVLDATNTTRARRRWLEGFFAQAAKQHAKPDGTPLAYRMLFIESVCTDENIITENILRSKCDNDDFKGTTDTNEVISEFRDRIRQYEKVYEPLHADENFSFIKIINVKHHVVLHRVAGGLGSRIAFFLMNLHPVAYPVYLALPGETIGESQGVFGGDQRLTERGTQYALALREFMEDRFVPNMLVIHATSKAVVNTLLPVTSSPTGTSAVLPGTTTSNAVPDFLLFDEYGSPNSQSSPAQGEATSTSSAATPHPQGHPHPHFADPGHSGASSFVWGRTSVTSMPQTGSALNLLHTPNIPGPGSPNLSGPSANLSGTRGMQRVLSQDRLLLERQLTSRAAVPVVVHRHIPHPSSNTNLHYGGGNHLHSNSAINSANNTYNNMIMGASTHSYDAVHRHSSQASSFIEGPAFNPEGPLPTTTPLPHPLSESAFPSPVEHSVVGDTSSQRHPSGFKKHRRHHHRHHHRHRSPVLTFPHEEETPTAAATFPLSHRPQLPCLVQSSSNTHDRNGSNTSGGTNLQSTNNTTVEGGSKMPTISSGTSPPLHSTCSSKRRGSHSSVSSSSSSDAVRKAEQSSSARHSVSSSSRSSSSSPTEDGEDHQLGDTFAPTTTAPILVPHDGATTSQLHHSTAITFTGGFSSTGRATAADPNGRVVDRGNELLERHLNEADAPHAQITGEGHHHQHHRDHRSSSATSMRSATNATPRALSRHQSSASLKERLMGPPLIGGIGGIGAGGIGAAGASCNPACDASRCDPGSLRTNGLSDHPAATAGGGALQQYEGKEECMENGEALDEVLCPVPGLDDINYGRLNGRQPQWLQQQNPRVAQILFSKLGRTNSVASLMTGTSGEDEETSEDDEESAEEAMEKAENALLHDTEEGDTPHHTTTTTTAPAPLLPQVISGKQTKTIMSALRRCWQRFDHHFANAPHSSSSATTFYPTLSFTALFPNGESYRQVVSRLEPALMAVMRAQKPVFVVAPVIPTQGLLAFFLDIVPEKSPLVKLPKNSILEITVKGDVVVHPLPPPQYLYPTSETMMGEA